MFQQMSVYSHLSSSRLSNFNSSFLPNIQGESHYSVKLMSLLGFTMASLLHYISLAKLLSISNTATFTSIEFLHTLTFINFSCYAGTQTADISLTSSDEFTVSCLGGSLIFSLAFLLFLCLNISTINGSRSVPISKSWEGFFCSKTTVVCE